MIPEYAGMLYLTMATSIPTEKAPLGFLSGGPVGGVKARLPGKSQPELRVFQKGVARALGE